MNTDITRHGIGPRMSEAVAYNGILWVAGQLGEPGGSVADQTRQALAAIDAILAKAGTDKTKILRAQIYLPNLSDFPRMNEVWEKWVVPGHTPTRATVQAALANPKWKIEVVITAAV